MNGDAFPDLPKVHYSRERFLSANAFANRYGLREITKSIEEMRSNGDGPEVELACDIFVRMVEGLRQEQSNPENLVHAYMAGVCTAIAAFKEHKEKFDLGKTQKDFYKRLQHLGALHRTKSRTKDEVHKAVREVPVEVKDRVGKIAAKLGLGKTKTRELLREYKVKGFF